MNATDNASNSIKGRPTSIPLLIAFGVLGVAAYYAGPTVMAYAFLFQEEAKSRSIYESTRKSNAQGLAEISDSREMPTPVGGPSGGLPGAMPDPEELFKRRDVNGDGKLEGSEISERMQSRVAGLDKDGDGAISKEEFMAQRQPGRNANSPSAPFADAVSTADAVPTDLKPETAATPVTDEPAKEAPKE